MVNHEERKRRVLNALKKPISHKDLKYLFLFNVDPFLRELEREGKVRKERRGKFVYYWLKN